MDPQALQDILDKHQRWLAGDQEGERANLWGANLRGANLWGANLWGANLEDANLEDANLRGCAGNRQQIKSVFISEVYPITYTSEYLQIGCERHALADWWEFDDAQIRQMDGQCALDFWAEWKDTLRMLIEKHPAVATRHEETEKTEEAVA